MPPISIHGRGPNVRIFNKNLSPLLYWQEKNNFGCKKIDCLQTVYNWNDFASDSSHYLKGNFCAQIVGRFQNNLSSTSFRGIFVLKILKKFCNSIFSKQPPFTKPQKKRVLGGLFFPFLQHCLQFVCIWPFHMFSLSLLYWYEKILFCPRNIDVFSNFSSHVWYPFTKPRKNGVLAGCFLCVLERIQKNICTILH